MFSLNDKILCFSLFNAIGYIWSLVQIPEVEQNDIAATETIIRNTVNHLFVNFRIKEVKHKPRLKDFSIIHNFFISMTLKDCDNLKEIANLTRVNNIDNNTKHLISQINEVLNGGDNSIEETEDIYVTKHIELFINKLRNLKESYGLDENYGNFSINSAILKLLDNKQNIFSNLTDEIHNRNYSDDRVLPDIEIWKPTERSGRRIFEGHRTRIKYYPFVATIQFFEKFQCAGSIIYKDVVITAASCLQLAYNNRFFRENPAFLSVQVGCDYYEGGGENIAVLDVFFHPDYQPSNLNNNLVLLRLGTNIVFSKKIDNVKRIWFDRHPSPLPSNTDGIVILGWGARDPSNIIYGPFRSRLSYAELDIYPLKECQEIYSKEYVTDKNFCAGFFSKGGGACNHDIGGPGVSGGILLGVISFGPPICGTPDAPTVFTKLGYYKQWIDSIMRQQVSRIVRLSTKRRPKSTFALQYSDTTRAYFTVRPIRHTENFPGYVPIPTSGGSLRILKDDKLFKEFMSTMFESREAKDYASPVASDDSCENDERVTRKPKRKPKKKKLKSSVPRHTTAAIDANEADDGNIESEAEKYMKDNNTKIYKDMRAKKQLSGEDDLKLNDDITNLLDDLDLYKLLNSEEVLMNSVDDDGIAARAVDMDESTEARIHSKKNNKKSVQTFPHSTSQNKKAEHRSDKKMRQSSDKHDNKNTNNKVDKKPVHVKTSANYETSNTRDGDKTVKKELHSSDKNKNYISRQKMDQIVPSSDNDDDTQQGTKTENESVQNELYSEIDKEEILDEVSQEGNKTNLIEKDEGTNENTENNKSLQNEQLSDKDENFNDNAEASKDADENLSNLSDNDDDRRGNKKATKTLIKNTVNTPEKYKNVTEKVKTRQAIDEDSSNIFDDKEDTTERNTVSTISHQKLPKPLSKKKNAGHITKTTTASTKTTIESSENDDDSQSNENEEEEISEDNGGLSIADA